MSLPCELHVIPERGFDSIELISARDIGEIASIGSVSYGDRPYAWPHQGQEPPPLVTIVIDPRVYGSTYYSIREVQWAEGRAVIQLRRGKKK